MKKIIFILFTCIVILTACSNSVPDKFTDYKTNDFKSLYNIAKDNDALSQELASFTNDKGTTYLSNYKTYISYTFAGSDEKTLIKYNITNEDKYNSIQTTSNYPKRSDFKEDTEYYTAISNVEYKTEEASIPADNKMSYKDASNKIKDTFNSTFSGLGDFKSYNIVNNDGNQFTYTFDKGNGAYYAELGFFTFNVVETNDRIQYVIDNEKMPEEQKNTLNEAKSEKETNDQK